MDTSEQGNPGCLQFEFMGTWGYGPFDNDTAMDLVKDIKRGTFSLRQLQFECGDGPLNSQQAESVIALAALLAGERPANVTVPDLDPTVSSADRRWVRTRFRQAVRPGESEIYDFWSETDELDEWLVACSRVAP